MTNVIEWNWPHNVINCMNYMEMNFFNGFYHKAKINTYEWNWWLKSNIPHGSIYFMKLYMGKNEFQELNLQHWWKLPHNWNWPNNDISQDGCNHVHGWKCWPSYDWVSCTLLVNIYLVDSMHEPNFIKVSSILLMG
jgi:hypothetical protein